MNPQQEFKVYQIRPPRRPQPMKEGAQSLDWPIMLGQIDGKLDLLLEQDLVGRVAKLERWRSQVHGGGAVILFLISVWEILSHVHFPAR